MLKCPIDTGTPVFIVLFKENNVSFHNYIHEIYFNFCIWVWEGHYSEKNYEINEVSYGCLHFPILINIEIVSQQSYQNDV